MQVKPDTVMIELDASRAGKLIAKSPSAGAGAEAGAGAGAGGGGGGGATGDEAGRAPPSSIGRLAGRVLHVLWPYTYCGYSYYGQACDGRTYCGHAYQVLRGKVDLQDAKADAVGGPAPPHRLAASSQLRHIGLQPPASTVK